MGWMKKSAGNGSAVPDNNVMNSLLGRGSCFRGNLELDGVLRIDGDFIGDIKNTAKVIIGENGRLEGSVTAYAVVVGGAVRGNLVAAEKITILSTGMVVGDVRAPRLVVEDGVVLDGNCRIVLQKGDADGRSE